MESRGLNELTILIFGALYVDRAFQFNGNMYRVIRGLYTGTVSSQKIFALLMTAAIDRFRELSGFTGIIEYFVDDVLLHCDEFHHDSRHKLIDRFSEACAHYGLALNAAKT